MTDKIGKIVYEIVMNNEEVMEITDKNVALHRKMWTEIARMCKDPGSDFSWDITELKLTALNSIGVTDAPNFYCFACEALFRISNIKHCYRDCERLCPLRWEDICTEEDSLYSAFTRTLDNCDYSKASELALKIANLPVREWDEGNQCFK